MIHRRGRGQENKTGGRIPALDCPVCACPNRPGAAKCIYCGAPLPSTRSSLTLPYFAGLRSFLGGSASINTARILKASLNALFSAAMLALGTFFLLKAVKSGGYFNWASLLLFYLYGVALLKNAYVLLYEKKPDRKRNANQ